MISYKTVSIAEIMHVIEWNAMVPALTKQKKKKKRIFVMNFTLEIMRFFHLAYLERAAFKLKERVECFTAKYTSNTLRRIG